MPPKSARVALKNKNAPKVTKKNEVDDVDYTVEDSDENSTDMSEYDSDYEENEDHSLEDEPVVNKPIKVDPFKNLKERYEYNPVINRTIIIVHPKNRVSTEQMTKYEYVSIISQRGSQIENGGKVFTDVSGITDPLKKAEKEILDKKCPISILRPITDVLFEKWSANELSIPSL